MICTRSTGPVATFSVQALIIHRGINVSTEAVAASILRGRHLGRKRQNLSQRDISLRSRNSQPLSPEKNKYILQRRIYYPYFFSHFGHSSPGMRFPTTNSRSSAPFSLILTFFRHVKPLFTPAPVFRSSDGSRDTIAIASSSPILLQALLMYSRPRSLR